MTVTTRNGKKKTVDFYFRLRKKKNAPKKFIRFLILLPNSSWSDVKSPLEHKYGIEKYDTCRLWYRYGYYTSRYYFMLVLILSFSLSRSHQWSLYCLPYNSYDVCSEDLVLDQLQNNDLLIDIFLVTITYVRDIIFL